MSAIPPYDISMDELYVGISFANELVTFPPVQKIETQKTTTAKDDDDDDDDDFDVFGDDDDNNDGNKKQPKESSRAETLARLKQEAEDRAAKKEAKQRTLVAIEIKPWEVEQDLMTLWRKITETITQPGLKWGESCTLVPVAFGIQKIQVCVISPSSSSMRVLIDCLAQVYNFLLYCLFFVFKSALL